VIVGYHACDLRSGNISDVETNVLVKQIPRVPLICLT